MKVESVIAWGGWLTALAGRLGVPGHRHAAGLRVPRDARMAAQLGAADRARHRRERRPARHGGHARHARRSFARAGQSRLGRTVARITHRYQRSGRHGVRAIPVSRIIFQLAARQPATAIVFFNRANRFPAWMPPPTEPNRYPVALVTNPPEGDALRERVSAFSAARFRYATFDMTLGGQPYQIVARLVYTDALQETLHSVIGFTVNLDVGAAVVLSGHPVAGGAHRDARQQPRHRRS